MIWINKYPKLESFFLYGISFILMLLFFLNINTQFSLFFFSAAAILDSGHVYLTFYRVITHSENRKRIYLIGLFIGLLVLTIILFALQIPKFWTFFVYFTFFHHLKQNIGLMRIYSSIIKLKWKLEENLAQFLLYFSFLTMHFRPNLNVTIYSSNDLLLFPRLGVYQFFSIINFLLLFLLLYSVYKKYSFNKQTGAYALYLTMPTIINVFSFTFANNLQQMISPLLIYHSLTYLWITSDYIEKKKNQKKYFIKIIIVLTTIVLFLGAIDNYYSDQLTSYNYTSVNFKDLLFIVLLTIPALWHYVVDGIIWKTKDVDFFNYKNNMQNI